MLISRFVALAIVWAYAIFCVYGFYRILAAQEVSLERFVLCCAPIVSIFMSPKDNLKYEGGESERISRSKWYSLKRPMLPKSIWEWNRNNEHDEEGDFGREP